MPRTPINYQNTVIYKIVCNDLNITDLYIGNTTDFTRRLSQHRRCSMNAIYKEHNYKIYRTIRENGGWENWRMIEIEKYPCNDSNEATARERYWFEALQAKLNMVFPKRSDKEYMEANKEKIKEYQKQYRGENREERKAFSKQYYETNKNAMNAKKAQPFNCVCGSIVRVSDKAKHLNTKKHLKFIEEQNI